MKLRKLLDACEFVACDIELDRGGKGELACLGFATSPSQAYVIPAHREDLVREVLLHPVPKVWANGKFDLYFLKYRCGMEVRGDVHDVMAAWFSLYPELAGKAEGKGSKITRKSLAFLSSLFTYDEWWKGVYTTETEYFIYNGKDCCITYDVFLSLREEMRKAKTESVYDHVRSLIWPCVDMLERGLNVDEGLRKKRLSELETREQELKDGLQNAIQPLLMAFKGEARRLFEQIEGTCTCCGHGVKKQSACWACAGFEKAPSKAELVARGGDASKKKSELEEEMLGVCKVCGGAPRREWLEWNPSSHTQNKVILYEVLKLPKRMSNGSLSSDEDALKGLLGVLQDEN